MGFQLVRRNPGREYTRGKYLTLAKYIEEPGITDIVIPDGVQVIGQNVFSDRKSLTSVVIPEGVVIIEEEAFRGCTALTSVTLPSGLKELGSLAFGTCRSLTSIDIPEGITVVRSETFDRCKALTSVRLPKTLQRLEFGAFYQCSGIPCLEIPDGLQEIGTMSFEGVQRIRYRGMVLEEYPYRKLFCSLHWMFRQARSLLVEGNYDDPVDTGLFMVHALALNPGHPTLLSYLDMFYDDMLKLAIEDGYYRGVETMLAHGEEYLDTALVDDYIAYANEQGQYEIQLLLMQYKDEKIGYSEAFSL